MRNIWLCIFGAFVLVTAINPTCVCYGQAVVVRKPLKALLESLTEYFGKRGARELGKELSELGGETALEGLLERTAREGGEEAVERLVQLSRKCGPDVIRAAENAPNASKMLRAIDELPADIAPRAAKQLAAGAGGKALTKIVDEFGAKALRAEVRHPGIGGQLVSLLGDEGAQLATRIDTNQAIQLARNAGDISRLPGAERGQVLTLIKEKPEGMFAFMKRFVEQNPGKVLFTASATSLILANREAILGGGQIVLDKDGNPTFVPKPGVVERWILAVFQQFLKPLLTIVVVAVVGFVCIKLWHAHKRASYKTNVIAAEAREQAARFRKEPEQP